MLRQVSKGEVIGALWILASGCSPSEGTGGTGGGTSIGTGGSGGASSSGGAVGAGGAQTGGSTGSGGSGPGGSTGSAGSATGGASGAGGNRGAGGMAGATGGAGPAGATGTGGAAGHPGGGAGGSGTAGSAGAYDPCSAHSPPCKILPFGDSITYGVNDEGNGGYRGPLFASAVAAGQKITFTGSLTDGPTNVSGQTFPQHNEGHSGWGISAAAGKHVTIVDMYTGFNTSTMLGSDSIHPNTSGHTFMASHWYSVIGPLLPK